MFPLPMPIVLAAEAAAVLPGWAWVAFLGFVAVMLALDLGVFNRKAHKPSFREAAAWCVVWVSLAVGFALVLNAWRGPEDAQLFAAGYLLELALSVDNLFIFLLVFAHFKVPEQYQHRVLFWGILGAVVLRALFIVLGVAAVERFAWLIPVFGAFLLLTGVKLALANDADEGKDMAENLFVRLARRFLPLTSRYHGQAFVAREDGRRVFTPLLVVLLVIEGTDLVFAIDSIPAVLGILPAGMEVGEKRFVAFTSNIFAILGLRSMYFALAGFVAYFRFLKPGLAFILCFIGTKMLLPWVAGIGQPEGRAAGWVPGFLVADGRVHFPTELSLAIIGCALAAAMLLSLAFPRRA